MNNNKLAYNIFEIFQKSRNIVLYKNMVKFSHSCSFWNLYIVKFYKWGSTGIHSV